MENATPVGNSYVSGTAAARVHESPTSAVSWAAVIAGAVIASAVSFMLLAGGTGLGFVSMSPWSGEGASAATLGIGAIVWMIATHIISFGIGGYIAGRLRTKWVGVHTDETYFRDTAHGFLVWALSAVVSAILIGSALISAAAGTARAGAAIAAGTGTAAAAAAGQALPGGQGGMPTDYVADLLLRAEQPNPAGEPGAARAEVGRIVAASLAKGEMSAEDRTYVARVVAAQTGVDQPTAERRVDEVINRARQAAEQAKQTAREAADTARKAAAAFALWAFASMLIGAFVASWMATVGGKGRDDIV
ncbi:hypothetical protein CDO44_24515 [Pigmentiphaga sp. NML080357]|uniref:hypothetical protein n=1 Tax=Pigmentiphaga sp. NML080357 TaxID=2008675 RepID=UPI000B41C660|nr:hypothetical protein [Pigmentiphaga sp. NML080357]OVZ55379.1 hypothetical protein CDO44_24515 [Pigmentiphaga sp. NML080357]